MSIGFTVVLLVAVLALATTLAVSFYVLRELRELRLAQQAQQITAAEPSVPAAQQAGAAAPPSLWHDDIELVQQSVATQLEALETYVGEQLAPARTAILQLEQQLQAQQETVDNALDALAQQLAQVKEAAEQDPEARLYQRAAKLVATGATIEELMDACELPRAEVELLLAVHQRKQAEA